MKRIILSIALFSVSFFSFGQSHSKQEIIDWISSKISNYLVAKIYGKDIDKVTYQGEQLLIVTHGSDVLYKDFSTRIIIDWNKLSGYEFENRGMIWLKGANIEKQIQTYFDVNKSFELTSDSFMPTLDFNQEENLEGRLKKALDDLIAILKKERQGKNEPY